MDGLKVVKKIEDGVDRRQVAHTTYQMRNPFRQFADGVAGELDMHCYMQHAQAADLCRKGSMVLDVCCGRGLLIPFLRYRMAPPSIYVGVDAEPANAKWKDGADPRRESEQKKDGWGFPLLFVESVAQEMGTPVAKALTALGNYSGFDLIVYTSAIEHMQPAAQAQSLKECASLAKASTQLYLSCPITEPGRSGYDAKYAAHVYEPSEEELCQWLADAGWRVRDRYGLCTSATAFRRLLSGSELQAAEQIYRTMPREFALVTIASVMPASATEVAYVCVMDDATLF